MVGPLTSVTVCHLGNFVIRVAVSVNRAIQLLKRHQGRHELVICVKETAEPLFMFDVMDLFPETSVNGEESACDSRHLSH